MRKKFRHPASRTSQSRKQSCDSEPGSIRSRRHEILRNNTITQLRVHVTDRGSNREQRGICPEAHHPWLSPRLSEKNQIHSSYSTTDEHQSLGRPKGSKNSGVEGGEVVCVFVSHSASEKVEGLNFHDGSVFQAVSNGWEHETHFSSRQQTNGSHESKEEKKIRTFSDFPFRPSDSVTFHS